LARPVRVPQSTPQSYKLLWILTGIELESVRKRKRYVAPKSLASKTSHVHATKNLFLFPCVYRLVLLRFSGIAL
jgi:hypothetical protein